MNWETLNEKYEDLLEELKNDEEDEINNFNFECSCECDDIYNKEIERINDKYIYKEAQLEKDKENEIEEYIQLIEELVEYAVYDLEKFADKINKYGKEDKVIVELETSGTFSTCRFVSHYIIITSNVYDEIDYKIRIGDHNNGRCDQGESYSLNDFEENHKEIIEELKERILKEIK